MLLQILHERNNRKEQWTETKKNQENGGEVEGDGISSNDTQGSKNQVKPVSKRKIDHLEGEFKKINPTSFDEESKTREEAKSWLLDIKKYFHI